MNYFIYVAAHSYHDTYDYEIVENVSQGEAWREAHSLARELAENYELMCDDFTFTEYRHDNEIPEDRDINITDYWDEIDELVSEVVDMEVHQIRDDVDVETLYHCKDLPNQIIEKYCY